MLQSMTGFGQSQATLEGVDLAIEVNSVNRRNLEVSISIPREWQCLERDLQAAVKERFSRGKLHLQVQATVSGGDSGFTWDAAGLESSLSRLKETAARHGIEWKPDAGALVRLAGLNKADMVLPDAGDISASLLEQTGLALDNLLEMRRTEGAALAADLKQRVDTLATLAELLGGIREQSGGTVERYREIFHQRLRQAGLEIDLSDERVLKEIALFADKCDITEETTRLESHIDQLNSSLGLDGPVGRKLEFILQEVNREFNTIGSKANNIEVSRMVIEAKNELERIREQIQNIE
jgi:uncharacterized protein (TIGR00255 family)